MLKIVAAAESLYVEATRNPVDWLKMNCSKCPNKDNVSAVLFFNRDQTKNTVFLMSMYLFVHPKAFYTCERLPCSEDWLLLENPKCLPFITPKKGILFFL